MAREHKENIIYALIILKEGRTGEITKFVNDKVRAEVEEEYKSTKYLLKDRKKIEAMKQSELKEKQLNRKSVQNWLSRLEKDGKVSMTKYYVYSLTKSGQAIRIFAEAYGKTLFDKLFKIPLKGTTDEKLLTYINRLGLYIVYIFIRNSSPTVVNSLYAAIEENDVDWINQAIDLKSMFVWFTDNFYSKHQKYSTRREKHFKLMQTLENEFREGIRNLITSETVYQKQVFPDYYRKVIL